MSGTRSGAPLPAALVARSATLPERIAADGDVRVDPGRSKRRVARWRELVARGDVASFARRLSLDGLDPERAEAVVGEVAPYTPPPEWAEFVSESLAHAADPDIDEDRCLSSGDQRVALEELTVVFVRTARVRLETRVDTGTLPIGPGVLIALERELLSELDALTSACADVEFRLWRRSHIDPLREALTRITGSPGRTLYERWIGELRAGGLAELLDRYPVLARQLGTVTLCWIEATTEFLTRLRSDASAIASMFGGGRPLGLLVQIGGASSDPHRGGRRVVGCTFESGIRLIYKPKSLRTEVVYGELLEWLNQRGADPPLRVLRVLDRGDYGWAEAAQQAPAADRDAAKRFYTRAGMVLALMYALGGTDCHAENLVAAGEDPVAVDAETILHPSLAQLDTVPGAEPGAAHAAADVYRTSVLAIGFLPSWTTGPDGAAVDISALGAIEPQPGLERVQQWDHAGTDVARMVQATPLLRPVANVLRINGVPQRAEDYVDELCSGFDRGYRILLTGREQLLAPRGPLTALADAPVRVLFRSTHTYARALSVAQLPAYLRTGVEHSIELEALARPLLDAPDPARFWGLHRHEQRELEATDVPYFAAPGGAESLCGDDGRVLVRFRSSALETARQKLRSLSVQDLRFQAALIRASLGARSPAPRETTGEDPPGGPAPAATDGRGAELALEAAGALGGELARTAIRSGTSVAWVGLTLQEEADRWILRPTGDDLYEGAPGIAVFLAALARATGDRRWRELSTAALSPILRECERNPRRLAAIGGLGGGGGLGGKLYALALVAALLEDEQPLAAAQRLVRVLRPTPFCEDRKRDLLAGSAGTVAGLLALDRARGGDQRAVELAAAAGASLAAAAVELRDGSPTWQTIAGRGLDGVAHGTAGIAHALAGVASRTNDNDLATLAERAVRGESDRFDPGPGGWPDRRGADGRGGAANGWCHGAAGIGLTRLALLQTPLATRLPATLDVDLARARASVLASSPAVDHLCCGGAGEIEFLLELGRRRDDADALLHAHARCDQLAERILGNQRLRLAGPDAGGAIPRPGLFQGTSGIGLALLRRAVPDLPSVLMWR